MLRGFLNFLRRGNAIDLAIAVVVGAAFGQLIASLVTDVIMPLIGVVAQVPDFSLLKAGPVALGKFLNALMSFVIIMAALYFLIVLPKERLEARRKPAPTAAPEPSEEAVLLRSILEELRRKP